MKGFSQALSRVQAALGQSLDNGALHRTALNDLVSCTTALAASQTEQVRLADKAAQLEAELLRAQAERLQEADRGRRQSAALEAQLQEVKAAAAIELDVKQRAHVAELETSRGQLTTLQAENQELQRRLAQERDNLQKAVLTAGGTAGSDAFWKAKLQRLRAEYERVSGERDRLKRQCVQLADHQS